MKVLYTLIIFLMLTATSMAEGYLIYLPIKYRQHNMGPSCVYASVSNCIRGVHMWKEADKFWNTYKMTGSEDLRGISNKLDHFNIKYKKITNGNELILIDALKHGRMVAITWNGAHVVNLVGKIDGKAYIVDNQSPDHYKTPEWNDFLSNYRHSGGWGIVVLDGWVSKSITQDGIQGFDH